MTIERTNMEHIKIYDTMDKKIVTSNTYNYVFDKKTGFFARWGKTKDEDPVYAPMPEILDIEVTTKCNGINGVVCPFCFPENVNITLGDKTVKKIKDIQIGDIVESYDIINNTVNTNKVLEKYEREYAGILIVIELENGIVLKVTPNHPIFVNNKGWIEAEKLLPEDDVIFIPK